MKSKWIRAVALAAALLLSPAARADVFDAAREGDVAALQAYAAQGGSLDVRNSSTYTPFILATYYGHNDAAAALLKLGADPCAVDDKGSNAFMGVAFKGHTHTAKWLLENTKCGVNSRNYAGQTALMMAALFDREEMVRLLLQHGADPALADHQGNTAQSLAQGQGLGRILDIIRFHLQ